MGRHVCRQEHAESRVPHPPGLACRAAPPAAGDRLPTATAALPPGQGRLMHSGHPGPAPCSWAPEASRGIRAGLMCPWPS